jgi:hypothetical protein
MNDELLKRYKLNITVGTIYTFTIIGEDVKVKIKE